MSMKNTKDLEDIEERKKRWTAQKKRYTRFNREKERIKPLHFLYIDLSLARSVLSQIITHPPHIMRQLLLPQFSTTLDPHYTLS